MEHHKRNKRPAFIGVSYVLGDFLAVIIGFVAAFHFRFSNPLIPPDHIPSLGVYLRSILVTSVIFVILFRYFKLYQPHAMLRRWDVAARSVYAISLGIVLVMALTFLYRPDQFLYSRLMVLFSWFFVLVSFNGIRFFINKLERRYIRAKGLETRVVILGINRLSRQIIQRMKQARYSGFRVVGIYTVEGSESGTHIQHCEVLGSLNDFKQSIDALEVDEVILTDPKLSREKTAELMLCCEERFIHFKVVADLYGMVTSAVEVQYMNTIPILGLKALPLDDLWNRMVKRIFDLLGSVIGLVLLTPLFLLVAIWIKIEDDGPVFYKQERIGRGGKSFNLIKFRTMRPDAEAETGPVWASAGDDRKTRVGALLRKTNIDELPQLWNVWLGEMSLVGPRPERPHFVEKFKTEIPRYMTRHSLKSGITGWAQVHGYRGDADTAHKGRKKIKMGIQDRDNVEVREENQLLAERIQLDLYYAENWSLLFDFEITLRTLISYKNAF